jgi:1-acyl-sn-glycerol-3-phosphate acyltransferase
VKDNSLTTRLIPVVVWLVINVGPMWWTIYTNKRSRYDNVRDAKYLPFVRFDYVKWSYFNALFTHVLMIPRFVLGFCFFFTACILCAIICIGSDPFNLPKSKEWLCKFITASCLRPAFLCAGIWMRTERIDADYSKYLGPDYKKTYEGAGIYIQNHFKPLDSQISWTFMEPHPGLLGKREALKVPLCRYLVGPLKFLLASQEKKDSKDVRDKLFKDIEARQLAAERGEVCPLAIYPEGATSNGKYLLTFKRGAFFNLRKVKPHVATYWTLTGAEPVHGDAISLISYLQVLIHCGFIIYTQKEMPVFEPNEFFWKTHWQQGKEEKWECYARCMQKVLSENSKLVCSNASVEQKLEYKHLIRGTKRKTADKEKS